MTDLTRLTAAGLADKLAAGEVSSVEATSAHLDRIAAVDGDLHAFLHVNEGALAAAADIDRRVIDLLDDLGKGAMLRLAENPDLQAALAQLADCFADDVGLGIGR